MKEELIKFETAKLAKEKGFNWKCVKAYQWLEEYDLTRLEEGWDYQIVQKIGGNNYNWNVTNLHIAAPTQSLLQKWLRDEHGVVVYPIPESFDCWFVRVLAPDIMSPFFEVDTDGIEEETYELVLEKGLIEGLKLIKL